MIKFKDISKSFKSTKVLDGVNLEIPPEDRVALVGLNGAGKTTLIRVLLGEYTYEGEVLLSGMEPRSHRCEVLRHISFVPQMPPPLKMPVGELIHFASNLCNSSAKRVEEIAASLKLEISPIRSRPFVKLSGGQKQKLLIAIALGRESDILVLDEPAANLDPESRGTLFNLLAERKHYTMIISSHRLDEVSGLVNRVVELDSGKVVLDERVNEEIGLETELACRLVFQRDEGALVAAVKSWGFSPSEGNLIWTGCVQGADRFRFMGALSKYSGLLLEMEMKEVSREEKKNLCGG